MDQEFEADFDPERTELSKWGRAELAAEVVLLRVQRDALLAVCESLWAWCIENYAISGEIFAESKYFTDEDREIIALGEAAKAAIAPGPPGLAAQARAAQAGKASGDE